MGETLEEKVEAAIETATKEQPKEKKDTLGDEGEFFVRRIAEEVTKSIAGLLNPPKPAVEDDDEDDDSEEDSPVTQKKRKRKAPAPAPQPKKLSFFERLKFPGGK